VAKFLSGKILSTQEQEEETDGDVQNLIEKCKCDEELGPIAVTSENFCKESLSDNNQHIVT
jgi:hypothetical protein